MNSVSKRKCAFKIALEHWYDHQIITVYYLKTDGQEALKFLLIEPEKAFSLLAFPVKAVLHQPSMFDLSKADSCGAVNTDFPWEQG